MTHREAFSIENWDNEGGAASPAAAPRERGPGSRLPPLHRSQRDTAAACRARAEADLLKAATMDTANGRRRFEHSAASWTARGDLLARLEAGWRARTGGRAA